VNNRQFFCTANMHLTLARS